MSGNFVDVLVIGGGVIGLAIAKNIAAKGREVIILEEEHTFGSITSTRNSGVIHAGFYYSPESKKAKFCSIGNQLMREYCLKNKINIKPCGKVVVTSNEEQEEFVEPKYEYGILVDSFRGHNIGDVSHPDYKCSID